MNKLLIGILGGIIAITTNYYANNVQEKHEYWCEDIESCEECKEKNVQEKHEYWCEDIESCEECKEKEEEILREEEELYEMNKKRDEEIYGGGEEKTWYEEYGYPKEEEYEEKTIEEEMCSIKKHYDYHITRDGRIYYNKFRPTEHHKKCNSTRFYEEDNMM